eukprot:XP_001705439.1 Hypothetical protein GL50803_118517 [Giardia lamblia ATCC 50803]
MALHLANRRRLLVHLCTKVIALLSHDLELDPELLKLADRISLGEDVLDRLEEAVRVTHAEEICKALDRLGKGLVGDQVELLAPAVEDEGGDDARLDLVLVDLQNLLALPVAVLDGDVVCRLACIVPEPVLEGSEEPDDRRVAGQGCVLERSGLPGGVAERRRALEVGLEGREGPDDLEEAPVCGEHHRSCSGLVGLGIFGVDEVLHAREVACVCCEDQGGRALVVAAARVVGDRRADVLGRPFNQHSDGVCAPELCGKHEGRLPRRIPCSAVEVGEERYRDGGVSRREGGIVEGCAAQAVPGLGACGHVGPQGRLVQIEGGEKGLGEVRPLLVERQECLRGREVAAGGGDLNGRRTSWVPEGRGGKLPPSLVGREG